MFFQCGETSNAWDVAYKLIPDLAGLPIRKILYLDLPHKDKAELSYRSIIVAETMLAIWKARNDRVFNQITQSPQTIVAKLKFKIRTRIKLDHFRLGTHEFESLWSNRSINIGLKAGKITVMDL